MPSFDIVSEVDKQEIDNAINQARKDLAQRFDFKGSNATIEWKDKESTIEMNAENGSRLKSLSEIVIGKLAKRNIDLRNVDRNPAAIALGCDDAGGRGARVMMPVGESRWRGAMGKAR